MGIKSKLRSFFVDDLSYVFLNHFVNHIPFWTVRKFFYILLGMKIGKGSRISQGCIVMYPKGIVIGKNNVINEYVLLDGRAKLVIGNNNSISMYAKIYTGTHDSRSNTFEYIGKKTTIEDNTWIGTSSVVMPGSSIKKFVVISVNSVISGETIEKGIYMGIPAVYVKERLVSEEYTLRYKSYFR